MIGSLPYIRRLVELWRPRHDVNPPLTALSLHRHLMPWSSQVSVRKVIRLFISECKLAYLLKLCKMRYANALLELNSDSPVKICQATLANLFASATIALRLPRRFSRSLNHAPKVSCRFVLKRDTALAP